MAVAVDPSAPGNMTGRVVLLGPFSFEQCLGFAVAYLLLPIGQDGLSPVVPYHRRRIKTQRMTLLPQSPTYINVITGSAKLFIETAYFEKGGLAKCHVTAGKVFRLIVRNEHMDRATRRLRDTIRDWSIVRGWYIRSADPACDEFSKVAAR